MRFKNMLTTPAELVEPFDWDEWMNSIQTEKENKTTDKKPTINPNAFPSDTTLQTGMELRDWFAGQAMAALITSFEGDAEDKSEYFVLHCAEDSYVVADRMLKQREK